MATLAASSTAATPSRALRSLVFVNVVVLLALGVLARVWRIDTIPGVNGDEAWMGVQALSLLSGEPVCWRTPTGNPLNPFAFLPLVASHAVFAPSVAHLRWVALASGLMALAVNFALCRRVFGPRMAVLTTVALAVLPVNIAYSRFGWDASQTLLLTLPVLYLPLLALREPERAPRHLACATVAWLASVLVHPTNVFAAPLVIVPAVACYRVQLRALLTAPGNDPRRTIVCLAASFAAGCVAYAGTNYWPAAIARAVSPADLSQFLRLAVDLFSGTTVYRFIAGTMLEPHATRLGLTDLALLQLLWGTAIAALGWGLLKSLAAQRDALDGILVAAVAATFVGFYLVAGPDAIRPHYERYAQCLVAGGVLLAARGADDYLANRRARRPAIVALTAIAWFMLVQWVAFYQFPLARGTGHTHVAFRTGDVEPKRAALDDAIAALREQPGPGRPSIISTRSWWLYWPLRYFAFGQPGIQVVRNADLPLPASAAEPTTTRHVDYWIDFDGAGLIVCHRAPTP